ncbi:hypothetical protein BDV93DRAFT_553492 [Ceratobasidium sp. AG-I]|nr:hypothetical protein BDV93DRAFT_553492 [Ceratobasidium sp. AG-I]
MTPGNSQATEGGSVIEYIYQARWTENGWSYEVHWYGYTVENDTWESEENVTNFGAAGLVDRFWTQFPNQRHAAQVNHQLYTVTIDWLKRKRFLAHHLNS